jgi:hypothetical protein
MDAKPAPSKADEVNTGQSSVQNPGKNPKPPPEEKSTSEAMTAETGGKTLVDEIMKGKEKKKKNISPKAMNLIITIVVLIFVVWRVGAFNFLKDVVPSDLFTKKPPEKQLVFSVVYPYREPSINSGTGTLTLYLENKGPDDATINTMTITNTDSGSECQLTTKPPIIVPSQDSVKITGQKCAASNAMAGRLFTLKISMDLKATKRSKILSDIDMELNSMQKMDVPMDSLQDFFEKRKDEVRYMTGGQDPVKVASGGQVAGVYT